jgi:hypothetical protein
LLQKRGVTAQGQVLKRCNGDLAAANAIAARYGGAVGSTKPGTDPNAKGETTNNPWAPNFKGTADQAMAERARLIKVWGTEKAASMARSHNVDLAGRTLKGRAA